MSYDDVSLPLALMCVSWSVSSVERTDDGRRSERVYVIMSSACQRSRADEKRADNPGFEFWLGLGVGHPHTKRLDGPIRQRQPSLPGMRSAAAKYSPRTKAMQTRPDTHLYNLHAYGLADASPFVDYGPAGWRGGLLATPGARPVTAAAGARRRGPRRWRRRARGALGTWVSRVAFSPVQSNPVPSHHSTLPHTRTSRAM